MRVGDAGRGEPYGEVLGVGFDGFKCEGVELLDWLFGLGSKETGSVDGGLVNGDLALAGRIFAGGWRHDARITAGFGGFLVLWSWSFWVG